MAKFSCVYEEQREPMFLMLNCRPDWGVDLGIDQQKSVSSWKSSRWKSK